MDQLTKASPENAATDISKWLEALILGIFLVLRKVLNTFWTFLITPRSFEAVLHNSLYAAGLVWKIIRNI